MSKRTPAAATEPPETKTLALELIQLDGGTQTRDEDESVVAEYAQSLGDLPPVDVFLDEDGTYWLADGFHRYAAFRLQHKLKLPARIHHGTRRDALLFAAGANGRHGMRRSPAAKRASVTLLLHDSEWRKRSDRWIAQRCVVSHDFVGKIRLELYPTQGSSSGRASSSTSEPEEREGADGVIRTLPEKRRKSKSKPAMGFESTQARGPQTDADGNELTSEVEPWRCNGCGQMVTGDHGCLAGLAAPAGPEQLPHDAPHPAVVAGRPLRRPSPAPGTPPPAPPTLAWKYETPAGDLVQLELLSTTLMVALQGSWVGFDLKHLNDDDFSRLVRGIQETRP